MTKFWFKFIIIKLGGISFRLKNQIIKTSLLSLFAFSIFQHNYGFAQQIIPAGHYEKFINYSNEQGFFSQSIRCLLQDKKGRLWLGAQDGLTMYDGNAFKKFSTTDGFGTFDVGALCEDDEGNIWIGSMHGLYYHNGIHLKKIDTTGNKMPKTICWTLYKDKDGTIWAGTQFGITHFNPLNLDKPLIKNYYLREPRKLQPVNLITRKKDNSLVVGSHTGFFKMENDSFHKVDGFTSYLSCYHEFEDGTEWYSGWDRPLYVKKKNGRDTAINFQSGILSFVEDAEKNIWLLTWENGVFKFDGTNFIHYTKKEGLNFSSFWSGMKDKEGNLWFGSWGKGLYKYSNSGFYSLTEKNGLCSNLISFITKDTSTDNFYLGTDNCIDRYIPKTGEIKNFNTCENKPLSSITNIFTGNNSELYALSYGLRGYKITGDKIVQENWINGFQGEQDKNGVFRITRELGWQIFKHPDTIITNVLSNYHKMSSNAGFYKDRKNNYLLFNQFNGFDYYTHGENSFHFNNHNGFIFEAVLCAADDNFGNYWLGTNGRGLYVTKIINDTIIKIIDSLNTSNGLGSNIIHSIHLINNNIVAGTAYGLSILNLDNYKQGKKEFKTLNYDEGLVNGATNVKYVDENGQLWIATNEGVHIFDINKLKYNTYENTLYLSEIKLYYNDVNWEKLNFKLSKDGLPINLKLSHDNNHLTFIFNGICLSSPKKIKYKYILKGSDKDWSPVTHLKEVTYSNISPGTYTFLVTSSNNDGVWNKHPVEFTFIILPPFWQTWWFITLLLIVLIILTVLFIRWREKKLVAEMSVLESKVEERTYQLKEALHIVEEKKSEILDSIQYAKRIQFTLLAHENLLDEHLSKHKNKNALTNDYCLFFKPKDIVSGDFYWATEGPQNSNNKKEVFYLAICDSTGHGVPGAFMSLLNINYMNEAITDKRLESPAEIFNYVKEKLIVNISKDGAQDGMDGVLLKITRENNTINLQYAAANNAPVLIHNNELLQLPYNKIPVGKSIKEEMFQDFEIKTNSGDILWLYTDGYPDQFGGQKGKKLMYKKLNQLLSELASLPLSEQKTQLEKAFDEWKNNLEQVDDVCVIGIRL